jgi:hypothetical protein
LIKQSPQKDQTSVAEGDKNPPKKKKKREEKKRKRKLFVHVDTIILIEKLLTNFDLHIIKPLYYADNSSYQLLY